MNGSTTYYDRVVIFLNGVRSRTLPILCMGSVKNLSNREKSEGYQRYINALSASIRGTGKVFLMRQPKDVLTNNFNRRLMSVHKANHDIQIVIDQVS